MTKNKIINDGKEVINTELQGIKKLNKIIDKNFDKAVRALAKVKGRVIITGVGKSGHIASKISSTMSSTGTPSQYCSPTDMSHGDLGIISKKQQSSDWSNPNLSEEQINYAATDVIHLHEIREKLDEILERQNRRKLVQACIEFLPTRVELDLRGWNNDIFSHSS